MNDTGYFWFSQKALDWKKRKIPIGNNYSFHNYCVIDGKEMEYTAWSQKDDKGGCIHDDLIYLGYGEYSYSAPIS